ncbi:hypothetical protein DOM22_05585 [Bdellovibrio sp. ZAP7]|uniref:hypothetical protein n=1 Tax=Bdellovibrio sp. ZAP7 TaxID=2231053 RepID=UPI0011595462|nr:hypothetical protein [Bdellovibrio sp. ZAP7]QDK44669.1 hypothetical protein DOM22_05585 [Bdellovibrio sp. ZAP7]
MKRLVVSVLLMAISLSADAKVTVKDVKYYRDLTNSLRSEATFKVPMIGMEQIFTYQLKLAAPIYPKPIVSDSSLGLDSKKSYRTFFDRIFLDDNSHVVINGEDIPLTCVFIDGQDNRYSGVTDPRFPQFIMRVYLVANDYTCTGPLNPGFPKNGGKAEMWDTYIYFEIKDPTIMLPVEAKIRYRWNEFHAVLVR